MVMPRGNEIEKAELCVILLKGTPSYRDWLSVIQRKTRITKSEFARLAIEEWAERNGYPVPPQI